MTSSRCFILAKELFFILWDRIGYLYDQIFLVSTKTFKNASVHFYCHQYYKGVYLNTSGRKGLNCVILPELRGCLCLPALAQRCTVPSSPPLAGSLIFRVCGCSFSAGKPAGCCPVWWCMRAGQSGQAVQLGRGQWRTRGVPCSFCSGLPQPGSLCCLEMSLLCAQGQAHSRCLPYLHPPTHSLLFSPKLQA